MKVLIKDLEKKTEQTLDVMDILLGTTEGDNKIILCLSDGNTLTLSPSDSYEISAKQGEPEPEPPTPIDPDKQRIAELKALLSETDYLAIKYAEGWLTAEEYAPTKAQRQAWRDEINTLEKGG